jgi:hypothetical protein
MKMVGDWEHGEMVKGRWIYPNGLYYEGEFIKNKPSGTGVWYCKNGNVVNGEFEQKKKEVDEDAPPEEEEEGSGALKSNITLAWTSDCKLVESAMGVNSVMLE